MADEGLGGRAHTGEKSIHEAVARLAHAIARGFQQHFAHPDAFPGVKAHTSMLENRASLTDDDALLSPLDSQRGIVDIRFAFIRDALR